MSFQQVGLEGPANQQIQYLANAEKEKSGKVDEVCATRPVFNEETYSYEIPILSKNCVKQILGVGDEHVLTNADLLRLGAWWGANAEKGNDGSDWQLIYGSWSKIVNSPVGALQDLFSIERTKLPTEDFSNAITNAFGSFGDLLGFITNPENIIRLLAIGLGSVLVIRGWSGISNG